MKKEYYISLGISPEIFELGEKAAEKLGCRFKRADDISEINQLKVLDAMRKNRVNAGCLIGTTGYGHDDAGRDTLERVYADVFHTEAALEGLIFLTNAISSPICPTENDGRI